MKKVILTLFLFSSIYNASADIVDTNVRKLKSLNSCNNCDLREVNLEGAYIFEANLEIAFLSKANLYYSKLSWGANLTGVNFTEANLKRANLSGANLRNASLDGAIFCKTLLPLGIDDSGCTNE